MRDVPAVKNYFDPNAGGGRSILVPSRTHSCTQIQRVYYNITFHVCKVKNILPTKYFA
ncbi:hypothetical protein HMPREF9162_1953 [Selenomonas sp. oral taxon 137 str. F0430]|nr:hypothetical protein HMPREF9162_1953 [Selenomonas sp. oral taxon 137 str. F0430]EJP32362.1 hypothetical protein HMPREF1147_1038 [Selenomonas sp. FOBRC9]